MSVFFNGRLLTTPTVETMVNDSGLAPQTTRVGNALALIGLSEAGIPKRPTVIRNIAHARQVLRGGELLFACEKAFAPSAETGSPGVLYAVRVNPATPSTLTLKDGSSNNVIVLASTDYGLHTNDLMVKVEAGSVTGKKVTTGRGGQTYVGDNLARSILTLTYTGAKDIATVSVSNTQLVLSTSLTVPGPDDPVVLTLTLSEFPTVQQLVERLRNVADWTVTMTDGVGLLPTINALDTLTAANAKAGAVSVTGHLQVIIDWINSTFESFLTATRAANAGTVPANIGFTYLTGGNNGSATNTDWSDALEALQAEDVQWIVPLSAASAVWGLTDAHCQYMSSLGRRERRCFVGGATGLDIESAAADAASLNSDRTAYVYPGFYDYNTSGVLTLYPAYQLAAMVGAAFASLTPGEPLTRKSLRIRGLEQPLAEPSDTDYLIRNGVFSVFQNTRGSYMVVKSITTWRANENYNRVEVSVGAALDYVVRSVRERMEQFIGRKAAFTSLKSIVEETASVLRSLAQAEPYGLGLLAGDVNNPPYRNISAEITGDTVWLAFECSPVIPINYILVTVYANTYSGSYTVL